MKYYCKVEKKRLKAGDLNCKECEEDFCTVKNALIPLWKQHKTNPTLEDIAQYNILHDQKR